MIETDEEFEAVLEVVHYLSHPSVSFANMRELCEFLTRAVQEYNKRPKRSQSVLETKDQRDAVSAALWAMNPTHPNRTVLQDMVDRYDREHAATKHIVIDGVMYPIVRYGDPALGQHYLDKRTMTIKTVDREEYIGGSIIVGAGEPVEIHSIFGKDGQVASKP